MCGALLRLLIDLFGLVLGLLVDQLLHVLGALFVLLHAVPWRRYRSGGGRIGLRGRRLAVTGGKGEQAEQKGSGFHDDGLDNDRQSVPLRDAQDKLFM
jgi:hypothetical protein